MLPKESRRALHAVAEEIVYNRGDGIKYRTEMDNKRIYNIPQLKKLRRELRNEPTPAESALWQHLKAGKLLGTRWRRQYSVGNYILDFYCPIHRLCVELDGQIHYNSVNDECDAIRTEYLGNLGIRVLRFDNSDIWNNIENVINAIKSELAAP
ncbi:MAG: endonuclease domain-containing protein [Bacteroidaceae bacterium]|nr:endonuclease domain-containing protein [Bacteroidaceae bacterium]